MYGYTKDESISCLVNILGRLEPTKEDIKYGEYLLGKIVEISNLPKNIIIDYNKAIELGLSNELKL